MRLPRKHAPPQVALLVQYDKYKKRKACGRHHGGKLNCKRIPLDSVLFLKNGQRVSLLIRGADQGHNSDADHA